MPEDSTVAVRAITSDDLADVGQFLHARLNARLSAQEWSEAISASWEGQSPNHGFLLAIGSEVVGVNVAFYSERIINGVTERFCNLGALCVREDQRAHAVRLLRTVLRQKGYHFTDFSPSGNVVEVNRRLGFLPIDTSAVIVANLPWLPRHGTEITTDPREISDLLTGRELSIFIDHHSSRAAHAVVARVGSEYCLILFRRDRRRDLPLFASLIYVSNPEVFAVAARSVFTHLLLRHGLPFTLIERRIAHVRPFGSIRWARPRTKMFKSRTLDAASVDYLYSELTEVAW